MELQGLVAPAIMKLKIAQYSYSKRTHYTL